MTALAAPIWRSRAGERQTYCVLPRELALLETDLSHAYAASPNVSVVVDRRARERRQGPRRPAGPAQPRPEERRRIRSVAGRRIAERRAAVERFEPPYRPRAARRHAAAIRFVTPIEPDPRQVRDAESARLVIRFQAGDYHAFNELYALHFSDLCRYLGTILRDSHEAEDAAQLAFLKAFQALPRFEVRPDASVAGWLTCIARNEARCHHRKHGRVIVEDLGDVVRRGEAATAWDAYAQPDTGLDPELVGFINRLPEAQRQALALRHFAGLDTDEIATALGRTPVAVRKLEHRALRFLETRMRATGRIPARLERVPMLVRLRRAPVLGARRWSMAAGLAACSGRGTPRRYC